MSGEGRRPGLAQRLFGALIDSSDREEKGYPPLPTRHGLQNPEGESHNVGSTNNTPPKRLTVATTHPSTLIPPSDKLLVFRALTGIDTVPALTIPDHRSAPNVGIYARVVQAEDAAGQQYQFFHLLINACLAIQIIVAASLTALGAASGPHSAITAFGAINTIMAGILTYLKGSGLPDRLKHYQNEWRNIREYIEQREREFCLHGCELDVQEEVIIIESMYDGVKREIDGTGGGEIRTVPGNGNNRRSFLPQPHSQTHGEAGDSKKPEAVGPVSIPEPVLEKH